MNAQLNYMIARHHSAGLQRAAKQARLADDARAERPRSADPDPIAPVSAHAPAGSGGVTTFEIEPAIGSKR
jgi:hypothetical protein